MIPHIEWSKTAVVGIALAAALLCVSSPARAINVCGDGICQGTGIPPETPQNCQADCGFCGDGICGVPENGESCVADCGSTCLSFTLSSALKKSGCSGDDDGDCLDNVKENDLAFIVAPWYFYDEDENCSGAWYTDGPDALHYGRQDFFQVRPVGGPVSSWSTSGPSVKTVQITYFLLHPHDCQSHLGFGGHQGDSERVRYRLKSLDLRTWYLVSGDYYHHGLVDTFPGSYLRKRANELGTAYPSIAGDEDGHGSWPGENGSSSACAGSEDDFCDFGSCDCFRGTMKGAFDAGFRDYVATTRNIGGPLPESWRPSVVTITEAGVLSNLNVGHGPVPEFWTPRTDRYQKFCGWECGTRETNGDCSYPVHDETSCTTPLFAEGVVDYTYFTSGLAAASSMATAGIASLPSSLESEAVRQRLRDGLAAAVVAIASTSERAADFERRLATAADPLETLVPLLAGRTRAQQLEAIAWMLETAAGKLAGSLAPGLLEPDRLSPAEAEEAAAELLKVAVDLLQAEGYRAPEASEEDRQE